MKVLQVEHSVRDLEAWKRIARPLDEPSVVVDLELGSSREAEAFSSGCGLWARVSEHGLIENPRARILDLSEQAAV